jgi:hypothetical protein
MITQSRDTERTHGDDDRRAAGTTVPLDFMMRGAAAIGAETAGATGGPTG